MPREFSISIEIAASPELVWKVLIDVECWSAWTPSVTSIEKLDRGPLAEGTRLMVHQPKFPATVWTITSIDPAQGIRLKAGAAGARVFAHHSVQGIPGGSRATLSIEFDGVFGAIIGWVTRKTNTQYLQMEAAGLKRHCEAMSHSSRN